MTMKERSSSQTRLQEIMKMEYLQTGITLSRPRDSDSIIYQSPSVSAIPTENLSSKFLAHCVRTVSGF